MVRKMLFLCLFVFQMAFARAQADSNYFKPFELYGTFNHTYFLDNLPNTKGRAGMGIGGNVRLTKAPFGSDRFYGEIYGGLEYDAIRLTLTKIYTDTGTFIDLDYSLRVLLPNITLRAYFGEKRRWFAGALIGTNIMLRSHKTGTFVVDGTVQSVDEDVPFKQVTMGTVFEVGTWFPIPDAISTLQLKVGYHAPFGSSYYLDHGREVKLENIRLTVGIRF